MGLEGFFQQPWNHTKKLGCVLLPRQAAFAQVFNVLQDGARECALKPDLGKGTSVPGLWPWSAEGWSRRSTGKTRATALLGRLHRLQLSCPLAVVLPALRVSLTGMGRRAALTGHSRCGPLTAHRTCRHLPHN